MGRKKEVVVVVVALAASSGLEENWPEMVVVDAA